MPIGLHGTCCMVLPEFIFAHIFVSKARAQCDCLLCRGNGMSLAVLSKLLCYALPFVQACLLSIANILASAHTCWLCSLHHSQHFWWPSQPSCHPCHYCHWSHFIPKGSGLYFCSDLWSLLWNADGGEVTYPICWLPSTLLLDALLCYWLPPSCCLIISQRKFICFPVLHEDMSLCSFPLFESSSLP